MEQRPLLNPRRLLWLVALAVATIAISVAGLNIYNIQSQSDMVVTFVVIVVGGYLGLTASDIVLDKWLVR